MRARQSSVSPPLGRENDAARFPVREDAPLLELRGSVLGALLALLTRDERLLVAVLELACEAFESVPVVVEAEACANTVFHHGVRLDGAEPEADLTLDAVDEVRGELRALFGVDDDVVTVVTNRDVSFVDTGESSNEGPRARFRVVELRTSVSAVSREAASSAGTELAERAAVGVEAVGVAVAADSAARGAGVLSVRVVPVGAGLQARAVGNGHGSSPRNRHSGRVPARPGLLRPTRVSYDQPTVFASTSKMPLADIVYGETYY